MERIPINVRGKTNKLRLTVWFTGFMLTLFNPKAKAQESLSFYTLAVQDRTSKGGQKASRSWIEWLHNILWRITGDLGNRQLPIRKYLNPLGTCVNCRKDNMVTNVGGNSYLFTLRVSSCARILSWTRPKDMPSHADNTEIAGSTHGWD